MSSLIVTAVLVCVPITLEGVDKITLRCEGAIAPKEAPLEGKRVTEELPPLGPPRGEKYLIMYTGETKL